MLISDFHTRARDLGLDLESSRNLFVVAESATLRPGPILLIGHPPALGMLLQHCFPDRIVCRDQLTPSDTPCLLCVNTCQPQILAGVRACFERLPELICVANQFDCRPGAADLFDDLKLVPQKLSLTQALVQKSQGYRPVCHWPWSEFSVYVNGDIGVCCGAGGLDNATIANAGRAWNGEGIRALRRNLLNGEFKGICEKCPFRQLYNQGVIAGSPSSDLPIFPKSMSLIITEKCNLRCWFCGYTETYAQTNRIKAAPELDIRLLHEIAPRFWKQLDSLNTNCGGEVFLYPHWSEVLDLLGQYPPKTTISTSGGGIEVSEEDWYRILQTHTHWMFSVDSFDEQTHWIMRGCDLGIVRRNVAKIRRLRDAHFPDRVYGFSAVLMKFTIPRLFDFVRTAVEEYGAGMVSFQHVIGNPTQNPATEPQWRQLFNCELNKVRHYCAANKISMGHPVGYYLDEKGEPNGRRFFKHPEC